MRGPPSLPGRSTRPRWALIQVGRHQPDGICHSHPELGLSRWPHVGSSHIPSPRLLHSVCCQKTRAPWSRRTSRARMPPASPLAGGQLGRWTWFPALPLRRTSLLPMWVECSLLRASPGWAPPREVCSWHGAGPARARPLQHPACFWLPVRLPVSRGTLFGS